MRKSISSNRYNTILSWTPSDKCFLRRTKSLCILVCCRTPNPPFFGNIKQLEWVRVLHKIKLIYNWPHNLTEDPYWQVHDHYKLMIILFRDEWSEFYYKYKKGIMDHLVYSGISYSSYSNWRGGLLRSIECDVNNWKVRGTITKGYWINPMGRNPETKGSLSETLHLKPLPRNDPSPEPLS